MSSSIGSPISKTTINQIKARQKILGGPRTEQTLRYIAGKSAWVVLRSSVNTADPDDMLKAYKNVENAKSVTSSSDTAKLYELSNLKGRGGIGDEAANNAYLKTGTAGYRARPGITSMEVKSKNSFGTLMEAKVQFKVFSKNDLENIEKLYFRPGFSALLEWGNSIYVDNGYNPDDPEGSINISSGNSMIVSSTDFYNKSTAFSTIDNLVTQKRNTYQGNYDGMMGYITNFNWSFQADGSYDCEITLLSRGVVIEGIKMPKITDWFTGEDKEDEEKKAAEENKSLLHFLLAKLKTDKRVNHTFQTKSAKEVLGEGGPYAEQLAQCLSRDFKYYITGYEVDDGGLLSDEDKTIAFIRLIDLCLIYNDFVALASNQPDPNNSEFNHGDSTFYLDDNGGTFYNEHSAGEKAFSLNPTVAVMPYQTTDGDFEDCILRNTARNNKGLTEALNTYKKSGKSKFDVREILVCSIVLDDIMSRMVDGGIDTAQGMLDFLKQVLDEINKAFGNIIELDINYNHADVGGAPICNKFTIVDRKGPKKTDSEKINITGLNSTVINVEASSKISPEMGSMISIAANGAQGTSVDDLQTMVYWNLGSVDRHMPLKLNGSSKKNTIQAEADGSVAEQAKEFIEGFNTMYDNFNNHENVSHDGSDVNKYYVNGTAKLQSYNQDNTGKDPSTGVIPIDFSMELDGIHGFTIGSTFGLNQNILPSKYDKYSYIITGISHKIGSDNKWVTNVGTNFYYTS